MQKAGVDPDADEGLIALNAATSIAGFIDTCPKLSLWSPDESEAVTAQANIATVGSKIVLADSSKR